MVAEKARPSPTLKSYRDALVNHQVDPIQPSLDEFLLSDGFTLVETKTSKNKRRKSALDKGLFTTVKSPTLRPNSHVEDIHKEDIHHLAETPLRLENLTRIPLKRFSSPTNSSPYHLMYPSYMRF